MIYQQTGIKTFKDIDLKDFKWMIDLVTYKWSKGTAEVEVIAWEKYRPISRTFEFDVPNEWTSANVLSAVLSLDCFAGSTLIEE